jgi:lipopolysaccharide transport system permease protein
MFTIVFGRIAKIPTDGIDPFAFYLSGLVAWGYFSSCLIATSSTFISNAGIFGKVYFPRLVVPTATLLTNFLSFLVQFSAFIVLYLVLYFRGAPFAPNAFLLLLPLLLIQAAALGLGTGLIISALTTKYRDLTMVVGFGVSLWMYGTPIVYPLSQIPVQWHWVFFLNPMTSVIETFRFAFFGAAAAPQPAHYAISVVLTLLVLTLGLRMFHRAERTFLDTI